MGARISKPAILFLAAISIVGGMGNACGGGGLPHEVRGHQLFANPHAKPMALSPTLNELYVVNSPGGNLDVIRQDIGGKLLSVEVGVEPVGLAVKPDGSEVWVANHVSDSVSVVDVDPASPTRFQVIRTIQTRNADLSTSFDEPTGVVFASNNKAYVSLSSRNQIAVIDASTYAVTNVLQINAQEPRDMFVQGGHLFVPAFESGNKSELSSCLTDADVDGSQCTFNFNNTNFGTSPQLIGFDVDIVKDPNVPDRDLFVFDTTTDAQVDVVDSVGTLLYGITVGSNGKVFIAQTDARNDANGRAGSANETLGDLDNRMFLNQIGTVDCASVPCAAPAVFELEPLPPSHPAPGTQLATPHGIAISGDDSTLVVTASSSHRIATVDAASGNVLATLDVGAFPRGVVIDSDGAGAPQTAFVLNALDNTVSEIDISTPASPALVKLHKISSDPTPDDIRLGRIAFESASASSTGTFSCGSCHPDGHVDQLLWVIGAQCTIAGCDQEEPRSTMPMRGLRDTLPLHWDGVLGDPFGGPNGEVGSTGTAAANCTDDHSCFRQLVDSASAGVMCEVGNCGTNPGGLPGPMPNSERDDMATFLESVAYPPARSRTPDDLVSSTAVAGFSDFYENKGGVNGPGAGGIGPETCADVGGGGCHPPPFTAGTNSFFVNAFEAPTVRGMTDRYLQFSAGVTNVNELLVASPTFSEFPWFPGDGFDEFLIWSAAFGAPGNGSGFRGSYNVGGFDIFQMVEESSTGHSGAFGVQVTVNAATAADPQTDALLAALEKADLDGSVNVRGIGIRNGSSAILSVFPDGRYKGANSASYDRAELLADAAAGNLDMTFTATHRPGVSAATAQPGIGVDPVGSLLFDGRPDLPQLPGDNPMTLNSVRVTDGSSIFVDGLLADGTVTCVGGTFSPVCSSGEIEVTLTNPPTSSGLHLLQVMNDNGLISNELPIRVQ